LSDVEAALAGLKARFLARADEDLAALRLWAEACGEVDDAHRRLLHRLAGAAGTFGFHALSTRAKDAEDAIGAGAGASAPEVCAVLDELARITRS
jgi:HPt (histidine-containing phosphotransfer) domain-containing protein